MRAADHGCQILARFLSDSILYVSYFLTDNVVIQLTRRAGIGPLLLMAARGSAVDLLNSINDRKRKKTRTKKA